MGCLILLILDIESLLEFEETDGAISVMEPRQTEPVHTVNQPATNSQLSVPTQMSIEADLECTTWAEEVVVNWIKNNNLQDIFTR